MWKEAPYLSAVEERGTIFEDEACIEVVDLRPKPFF